LGELGVVEARLEEGFEEGLVFGGDRRQAATIGEG
jgi:hypothetical protein